MIIIIRSGTTTIEITLPAGVEYPADSAAGQAPTTENVAGGPAASNAASHADSPPTDVPDILFTTPQPAPDGEVGPGPIRAKNAHEATVLAEPTVAELLAHREGDQPARRAPTQNARPLATDGDQPPSMAETLPNILTDDPDVSALVDNPMPVFLRRKTSPSQSTA